MTVVRCYSILPPKSITYASEKRVYTLYRKAEGDNVHEEYPILSHEDMLTRIRAFLRGRGERIIGVTERYIYTEPIEQ